MDNYQDIEEDNYLPQSNRYNDIVENINTPVVPYYQLGQNSPNSKNIRYETDNMNNLETQKNFINQNNIHYHIDLEYKNKSIYNDHLCHNDINIYDKIRNDKIYIDVLNV